MYVLGYGQATDYDSTMTNNAPQPDVIANVEMQVIENPYYGRIDDVANINEQCQVIENPYYGDIDDICIV